MTETKELTGRKVLFILIGAFGIIISVNMLLLFKAVSTFPGLEVKNSYVASQDFNRDAEAQRALGWSSSVRYADRRITVTLLNQNGTPVFPDNMSVRLGRPTHARDDITPALTRGPQGFWFMKDLDGGKWFVYVDADSTDGTHFRTRLEFSVNPDNG